MAGVFMQELIREAEQRCKQVKIFIGITYVMLGVITCHLLNDPALLDAASFGIACSCLYINFRSLDRLSNALERAKRLEQAARR